MLATVAIGPNPCATNNGGCSHMCVLSAVEPAGYSCLCPSDYSLTENKTFCERKYRSKVISVLKMILHPAFLAPPRLLFSVYSNLIRRVNIDGENLVTVYTTSYPRVLDYDFRLDSD